MPLQSWKDYAEAAEAAGGTTTIGPLPDGKYNFKVIESEYREFASGSKGLATNCVIEDGPYQGKRVYKTFFIVGTSQASLNILFRQLAAMGVNKEYIYALPEDMVVANTQLAAELIGRRFLGTVVRDDRKPEYPAIKYVDPPLSGPSKVAEGQTTPSYPPAPGVPSYPSAPTTAYAPAAAPVAPAAAPTPAPAAPVPSAAPVAPAAPWVPQAASAPTAPIVDDPWSSTPPPAPVY